MFAIFVASESRLDGIHEGILQLNMRYWAQQRDYCVRQ